jgi:hypothetical protein
MVLVELLEPLPPGLDSAELRVARMLLSRLQDEHVGGLEVERIMSEAPWEVSHTRPEGSLTL